jgi:hypothetical protein
MRGKIRVMVMAWAAMAAVSAQAARQEAQNVFFVMTDGLRWQEVFSGADLSLMTKQNGVSHMDALKTAYWRETAEARRQALMPFLWSVMAKQG